MAPTAKVKDELARVLASQENAQTAETATLFRFAGGLHLVAGSIVLKAESDSDAIAHRLYSMLAELYDVKASLNVSSLGELRKTSEYIARITVGAEFIVRQTGLIDSAGRPVRGLPRKLIMEQKVDQEVAWRGAFSAHDSLTEPGRSPALEVTAPSAEAALALVGCARRLDITAKSKENKSHGGGRIIARGGDIIGALLTRMGAQATRLQWEEQRMCREVRATVTRLADFDDANLRHSTRAAVTAAARIERALEILGDDVPDHLVSVGQLRIKHKRASLEGLGQLANPPMTRDAAAERIHRLLSMTDRRANELGIPPTTAVVTDELSDKEVDE